MFDTDAFTFTKPLSALGDLRSFINEHADALLNAAALLGGQPGVRLARTALDGLASFATPSRSMMQAWGNLLDLLMLEHVHDPDRIESARFAGIDFGSPVVEEICLLADGLNARLEAYHDAMNEAAVAVTQQVAA
ncbi:hypothetical protein JSE7799_02673 [Jannaschia seosinensis]|uniref:Uncharacterized protein n=1 Tax=Jannaschia seosinensis TaxID=313367 RepID=A0A0M7BEZ0_9RHOB|nr:hypothetical protein [Jannaschia seosinensis]CUH39945.1 hypothetical protein JSE7799_02673 [Jannaschia seosinensis]